MNTKQFSDRMGNIDDRLIQQAEQIPNYGKHRRKNGVRRLLALAAVIALMACSGVAGALAFSTETVVEVPVPAEQETIELEDLTLILPDSWKGKYGYEADGNYVRVYLLSAREVKGWEKYGTLFRIDCVDSSLPMDFSGPAPSTVIASTSTQTYILIEASDMQYDSTNPAVAEEYTTMYEQIGDIQIVLKNWLAENSTNEANWVEGTVYAYYYNYQNGEVSNTVRCDANASAMIRDIILSTERTQDIGSVPFDIQILFNGRTFFLNSSTGYLREDVEYPYGAILSAEELQTIMSLLDGSADQTSETLTGYITIQDGKVLLDEVEIITEEDTDRIEELGLTGQGDLIGGYYIYNEEESTRTFDLTDKTEYRFVDFGQLYTTAEDLNYETTSLEEFLAGSSYAANAASHESDIPSGRIPYSVEVRGDTVISITEEFRYTI